MHGLDELFASFFRQYSPRRYFESVINADTSLSYLKAAISRLPRFQFVRYDGRYTPGDMLDIAIFSFSFTAVLSCWQCLSAGYRPAAVLATSMQVATTMACHWPPRRRAAVSASMPRRWLKLATFIISFSYQRHSVICKLALRAHFHEHFQLT